MITIDSDGHLHEPFDLFDRYLEREYWSRRPRVVRIEDHPYDEGRWLFEGQIVPRVPFTRGVGGGGMQYMRPRHPQMQARDMTLDDVPGRLRDMDALGIDVQVVFPTALVWVLDVADHDLATALCRAYNDYVAERFRKVSDRLHPMALIPMQDAQAAAKELRRAIQELDLPGAMIPSTGLSLHAGHEYYWPVYAAAAELECPLAFHGGSNRGIGIDSFSDFNASHILHHPVPLMYALVSVVCHGVLDRYPGLRVGFMEGGCGWLVPLLDRMKRNEEYFDTRQTKRGLREYIARGQVLIGCEGEDESMPYVIERAGIEGFAYSSDYPHEVDLVDARRQIEETLERADLSAEAKAAVLGGNSRRFFNL
jgi:predicted TIM-barrel fold metal-dependent hydrolase